MKASSDLSEVEVIRLGGATMADDIKSLKHACKMIDISPTMILGMAMSHQFQSVVDGRDKESVAEDLSKWIGENLASEITGGILSDKGEEWLLKVECMGDTVAAIVAEVLFSIKGVLDNTNITNEGKTYAYELLRISDSGALLLGRYGGDH